jgi:sulfiredoxin
LQELIASAQIFHDFCVRSRLEMITRAFNCKPPLSHLHFFDKMLSSHSIMMKRETFAIADIYVPTKRRTSLEQKRVDEIAASMLDDGQRTPILVRADGARFVLVEGLHRLEAAKALGEKTIVGFLVSAGNTESPAPPVRSRLGLFGP